MKTTNSTKTVPSRLKVGEAIKLAALLQERKDQLIENPRTFKDLAVEYTTILDRPVSPSSIRSICEELGIPSAHRKNTKNDQAERLDRIERFLKANFAEEFSKIS